MKHKLKEYRPSSKIEAARKVMSAGCTFEVFSSIAAYSPHPGQYELHRSKARFRLAVCGRRFGKSTAAAYEAAFYSFAHNARVWIVAPYRELAGRVWHKAREALLWRLGARPVSDRPAELYIRLEWGAELVGKTADNPDSLLGEGLDFAVVDEAPRVSAEIFPRYILPSLADRKGRALLIGSPRGRGWMYELAADAIGDPDWKLFHFPSGANPHLDPAEIALHRRLLCDADYRRDYDAEWIAENALVYPMFITALHTREIAYDPALPLFVGMDFGFTNPGCALFAQLSPSETLTVIDEIYGRGMTAVEWADAIKRKIGELESGIVRRIVPAGDLLYIRRAESMLRGQAGFSIAVDPARTENRHLLMGTIPYQPGFAHRGAIAFCDPAGAGERAVFERAGIATSASHSGVSDGIARVRALLAPGDAAVAPRLTVSPKCRNLIREFGAYSYEDDTPPGQEMDRENECRPGALLDFSYASGNTGERVAKRDDHALDALRYLVMGLGI